MSARSTRGAQAEGRPLRRPEAFGGKRFLLKSIHYDATHRADLFTLPCSFKASGLSA
jgi:hypothetical protein